MSNRGEYRPIYTVMPDTPEFQQLSKEAALLLYTLKMSLGASGIGVLYDDQLAERARLTRQEADDARQELVGTDWLQVEGRVHWLRNGLRFEPTITSTNENHRKSILRHLKGLPKQPIVNRFASYYDLPAPFPEIEPPGPPNGNGGGSGMGSGGDSKGIAAENVENSGLPQNAATSEGDTQGDPKGIRRGSEGDTQAGERREDNGERDTTPKKELPRKQSNSTTPDRARDPTDSAPGKASQPDEEAGSTDGADDGGHTVTIGEAAEALNRHLGLGTWWDSELDARFADVCTFVRKRYLGRGVDLEQVVHAAEGVRMVIDDGEISWLEEVAGEATDGPGVLVKDAVVDGPDGSQLRNVLAVGLERWEKEQQGPEPDGPPPPLPSVDVELPKGADPAFEAKRREAREKLRRLRSSA